MTTLKEIVVRVKFRNTLIEHLLFAVYLVLLGGQKKKKDYSKGSLTQGLPIGFDH